MARSWLRRISTRLTNGPEKLTPSLDPTAAYFGWNTTALPRLPPIIWTRVGRSSTEWFYQKRYLTDRFRLIVDEPGLGLSKKPDNNDYRLEKPAADLGAVLAFAGDKRAVLVGRGIGGRSRSHSVKNTLSCSDAELPGSSLLTPLIRIPYGQRRHTSDSTQRLKNR